MNTGDDTTTEGQLPIHPEAALRHVRPSRSGEGMASVLVHLRDHLFRKDGNAPLPDVPDKDD